MAEHAYDPQSAAFRDAAPAELVDDGAMAAMLEQGLLVDTTHAPIKPVEQWEAEQWDAERIGPKSPEEARAALAARVADPAAPDTDATLYDHL